VDHHTHAETGRGLYPHSLEKTVGNFGVRLHPRSLSSAKLYNTVQAWVINPAGSAFPAFIEEGLHGYMANTTVFPQSVNLGHDLESRTCEKTGAAIAPRRAAVGVDMILRPVLDVARDPRWGRVEEDFGEDPFLSGQLGLAYVRGMQGDSLATDHNSHCRAKTFCAHGSPESGLNMAPVHAGEREIRSVMLKSFEPPCAKEMRWASWRLTMTLTASLH